MSKKQKMVFWDFGDVIGSFSVDAFLENLAELFTVTPREILSFLESEISEQRTKKLFWHAIEGGQHWTPECIYQAFERRFGISPNFSQFIDYFNGPLLDGYGHGKRFIAFSKKLHDAGYCQGLISNANAIHAARMENELGYLLQYIPKANRYYSWELSCRKGKDTKIFDIVFAVVRRDLCIERDNIVFIDDRDENIEGCRKAGAKALEFNIGDGLYRLEENLRKIGFCV